jgi:ABC-type nickel/cobalt efflux system permease component RcnA
MAEIASVSFSLRVLLALAVISAFAAVSGRGIVAVLRAKNMAESQRMMAVGGSVILIATLAAWAIFFWPVYLDLRSRSGTGRGRDGAGDETVQFADIERLV